MHSIYASIHAFSHLHAHGVAAVLHHPAWSAVLSPAAHRRRRPSATVLYCESNTDGTIGGSHYGLLRLLENLDRSQFDPIVAFYEDHQLLSKFQAVAETIVLPPSTPVQWGASSSRGKWRWMSSPVALARRAVNFVQFAYTIASDVLFLRRRRVALVHLNNSITRHREWMLAALIARVPCITHERGINEEYPPLSRFLARRLSLIIPVSRWIEKHMDQRGISTANMLTMYDGLDPSTQVITRTPETLRKEWNVGADQPVFGIVGNIREWKGQDTVVRALIEVTKTHPDVVCFFVGSSTPHDQQYRARLKQLIDEAGIGNNVRFTGYRSDVPSFINMMQFVVHASVLPEPFGMVVLEAMAHRKAVIGSRAGGVTETIVEGETGYTFPPGDHRSLAAHMRSLLEHPQTANQMGANGYRRLLVDFSMPQYMDMIHNSYRAILKQRSLPVEEGVPAGSALR
jgi:L-malate glycosyltransferase